MYLPGSQTQSYSPGTLYIQAMYSDDFVHMRCDFAPMKIFPWPCDVNNPQWIVNVKF